jgi:undecaprenyl diphosphate synthase
MTDLIANIIPEKIPQHLAIIMDGNGRWAKERGENRLFGHSEGVESIRSGIKTAKELGIKFLTLYTFSTENWSRPQDEIDGLMDLLVASITIEAPELMENGVRILMIGDIDGLPENCAKSLKNLIIETQDNTSLTLILALNYSAKWELKMAIKSIAHAINTGTLTTNEITDDLVSKHLSTKGIPDPELLIRTSGERRISNFLLWQIAYAELYFTDTHWPDFRRNDLISAVIEYQNRERRFGKLSIQLEAKK